jgi:hypothetical protein
VSEIDAISEANYEVRTSSTSALSDLLDDDDELSLARPKQASTFERALCLLEGWTQGMPLLVDPSVADAVSAHLVSHVGRTTSGWQEWLRSGKLETQRKGV